MSVQRHERPPVPRIERTFTAVRAALPAINVPAFDAELETLRSAPVADLTALDDFLTGWWRIATRAASDPEGWEQMLRAAAEIEAGTRPLGPPLAEVLARRGITV